MIAVTDTLQTPVKFMDAAVEQAETLSYKLDGICELLKLAAFASEARKALESIHQVLPYYPKVAARISANMDAANEWTTFEDNTGSVLQLIARQLSECNQKNVQATYALERTTLKGGVQ